MRRGGVRQRNAASVRRRCSICRAGRPSRSGADDLRGADERGGSRVRLGGEIDATILSAVFVSSAGAATALQLAGAVLLLTTTGKDAFARTTQAFNAAVAMASFAFTGHAAAVGLIEGLIAFVHASAAAWWVGSLWALRMRLHSIQEDLAAIVEHFSRKAMVVIGALVLAGVVLIFVLVDFARVPALTPYAQVLQFSR